MNAKSTGIELGRGDLAYVLPPPNHAWPDNHGTETLRKLVADTRTALDAALARLGPLAAGERETRARLVEAQEALLARDIEYAESVRSLLDRLSELDAIRSERDAARRHAVAVESSCRTLEARFEHVFMKIPRRVARKIRALLSGIRRTRNDPPSLHVH